MRDNGEVLVRRVDAWRVVEVINESPYVDSAVLSRKYDEQVRLDDPVYQATSRHGVVCEERGQEMASLVVAAGGGASGVHEESLAVLAEVCFLAVGPFVVCLELPQLTLRWSREVDSATCFGVHLTPDQRSLVSHGEMEISRLTLDGEIRWQAGGRDIFTGAFDVDANVVRAEDFDGHAYTFDLETGKSHDRR